MQTADSNCSDKEKSTNFFNSMFPEFILVATRYFEALIFFLSHKFLKSILLQIYKRKIILSDIVSTNVRMSKSFCKAKWCFGFFGPLLLKLYFKNNRHAPNLKVHSWLTHSYWLSSLGHLKKFRIITWIFMLVQIQWSKADYFEIGRENGFISFWKI